MRITIIGAGSMGHGIAVLCLRAGHAVDLIDTNPEALDSTAQRLQQLAAPGHVRDARTGLGDLRYAEIVIDATPQVAGSKRAVLQECVSTTGPDCLIGTVTLGVPLSELDLSSDSRVIGLHFMNPPHRLLLCEIVTRPQTDPDLVAAAERFVDGLGLSRTTVADTPGFVLNRVLLPFLFGAVRALEEGIATAEEIDRTFTIGCGHPMGPLAVLDLVGLDVAAQLAEDLRRFSPHDRHLLTPELLTTKLAQGRGFHT